ncbi:MAG: DeoR/GlpR family DNA-binding transcription regulator [Chloroflexota bacterium]|nr:DeoR/GlpR family DNA-binding transcription regulator [Chloroflexota bacterium]
MANSKNGLIPAERRNRIHEIIRDQGIVRVSALSDLFDVAEITIRRDLEQLEQVGYLERTHGGAVYSRRMQLETSYTEKDQIHRQEKEQIGVEAAALVENEDIILVNSGSTTLQIFRHLADQKRIRVITSNMGAFREIRGLDIELILVGGEYREESNSLVGPLATLGLEQVYGNKCFIGVDGVSIKYGLTTPNLREAEVARMMIEHTRGQVIVVADHHKLGVVADFQTAPIEGIDILVTDSDFDESYREGLEKLGIEIVVASGDNDNVKLNN